MGKGGGGSIKTQPVVAEQPVTPAVAKSVAADTAEAQTNTAEARSRRWGIRSTYTRFAEESQAQNGQKSKLG